jgi:coxsackievirus/adenovirus receptor
VDVILLVSFIPNIKRLSIYCKKTKKKGSETVQCASDGRCQCKPGVVGDKCNQCAPYHYNFGPNGCTYVNLFLIFVSYFIDIVDVLVMNLVHYNHCNVMLKQVNVLVKHLLKDKTVTSNDCYIYYTIILFPFINRCRPGFYNLDTINPDGCTKCFCYGHASTCQSAPNYYYNPIRSSFSQGINSIFRTLNC